MQRATKPSVALAAHEAKHRTHVLAAIEHPCAIDVSKRSPATSASSAPCVRASFSAAVALILRARCGLQRKPCLIDSFEAGSDRAKRRLSQGGVEVALPPQSMHRFFKQPAPQRYTRADLGRERPHVTAIFASLAQILPFSDERTVA